MASTSSPAPKSSEVLSETAMTPNISVTGDGDIEIDERLVTEEAGIDGTNEESFPDRSNEDEADDGMSGAVRSDGVSAVNVTPSTSSASGGLKVLFLSSDTGGGHRASAESLARQFELLFPGSTYELLDLASEAYLPPYNSIVSYYKHLSAHPQQWKLIYGVSNSRAMERVMDTNLKMMSVMCERTMRRKLESYKADVVVSVHPLMTSVPVMSCAKISHETGKHLPMFTVVTDLGSAHNTWFASGVEKLFVGSKQIYDLAIKRMVPEEKIVLVGLPIRHDFSVEAERLGDRTSPEGRSYQQKVRKSLDLPAHDRKTLLVMGGGEGVGSLSNIVDALYVELFKKGIDAVICVVCGRNEKLKMSLEHRDWAAVVANKVPIKSKTRTARMLFNRMTMGTVSQCGPTSSPSANSSNASRWATSGGCIDDYGVSKSLRRILSSGSIMTTSEGAFFVPQSASPKRSIKSGQDEKKEVDGASAKLDHTGDDDHSHYSSDDDDGQIFKSNSTGAIHVSSPDPTDVSEGDKNAEGLLKNTKPYTPRVGFSSQTEILSAYEHDDDDDDVNVDQTEQVVYSPGKVSVVGLGFVTRMAEYMVAADVLVTKAGPGTISEAAAVSLPVMVTSFLPGQEEGNVDYVVDGDFGAFCPDSDPDAIAETVSNWLTDEDKLTELSLKAKAKGAPYAARDIVQQIGESALHWRILNETHAVVDAMVADDQADDDSVE